jgi:hypothetical protein
VETHVVVTIGLATEGEGLAFKTVGHDVSAFQKHNNALFLPFWRESVWFHVVNVVARLQKSESAGVICRDLSAKELAGGRQRLTATSGLRTQFAGPLEGPDSLGCAGFEIDSGFIVRQRRDIICKTGRRNLRTK